MNFSNTTTIKSWRDVLPVHPAADLFPLLSKTNPARLREMGEDIKVNGLQQPIVIWADGRTSLKDLGNRAKYSLLDGRNRLDAMELVGGLDLPDSLRRTPGSAS
jgi:hypothetical protein